MYTREQQYRAISLVCADALLSRAALGIVSMKSLGRVFDNVNVGDWGIDKQMAQMDDARTHSQTHA